jgi:hypothetical protein
MRDEQRPIVELQSQHVRRRRTTLDGEQSVPDLASAGAEVIADTDRGFVIADQLLLRRIRSRKSVRRPDPAKGGIDDFRVARGVEPTGARRGASRAARTRNSARECPRDMAVAITDDEILMRDADIGGEADGLFGRSRAFEIEKTQVRRLRRLRHPLHEQAAAVGGLRDSHAGVACIAGTIDDVLPVAVAVGEAPGDVSVRSCDEDGRTRERNAVQVERIALAR